MDLSVDGITKSFSLSVYFTPSFGGSSFSFYSKAVLSLTWVLELMP